MRIKINYEINNKNLNEVFEGNFEDLIERLKLYNELGIIPQLIVYPDDHKSYLDIINLLNLSSLGLRFNLSYYDNREKFYYYLVNRW